jgi:hypothetical protein
MTITHQIVSNPALPIPPGMNMLNQLSGLIGQANGLLSAGVSLPGIQGIGSQIAAMGSMITAAGGAAGSATDTSQISGVVASLGSQLSSVASMAGVSSIMSSLTTQLNSLTGLLNPAGGALAQVLHSHLLDAGSGITHSAFSGQHTVNLSSAGINLLSAISVAHTAPKLPHNGLTIVSDALQVAKSITGQSFGMLSDERLKTNIASLGPVLDKVMRLKIKTFDVKTLDWESGEIQPVDPRPSLGLIAQEMREVLPELVHDDGKYLQIEESKVALVLLAAFQEFVIETRKALAEMKQ